MLIKNNKIIVRKCSKETYEKLVEEGYELLLKDGKQLIIPFYVFDESDLFDNLKSLGVKYYAIPLDEEHAYSVLTSDGNIVSPFTVIEGNNKAFQSNYFTDTFRLIKELSYACQNPKNCTYTNLLKEMKTVVKNPIADYPNIDLSEISNFLENKGEGYSSIKELYLYLNQELSRRGIHTTPETFLKTCLTEFVFEPLVDVYRDIDLVFWYWSLPSSSRAFNDVIKNI